MSRKIISTAFLILFSINCLYSQDMRIGVDYLSKIKINNLSEVQKELLQNLIEDSLLDIIGETRVYSWQNSFTVVAQSKIKEILREQKIQEDLSECTDTSCAIKIGQFITAEYMIYRDISETRPGEYNFRFSLLNIETSETISSANKTNYKGDVLDGASIKPIFFDLMAELFNEAFWMESRIPNSDNRIMIESSQVTTEEDTEEKKEKGPNLLLILLGVLLLGAAASGGGGDGGGGGSGTGGVDIGIEIP